MRLYRLLYLLGAASSGDHELLEGFIHACDAGRVDPSIYVYREQLGHRLFMVAAGYLLVALGLLLVVILIYKMGILRSLYNYTWYFIHRDDYIVSRHASPYSGVGVGLIAAAVALGALVAFLGSVYIGYVNGFETLVGRVVDGDLIVLIGNHWVRANIFRVVVEANGSRMYSGVFLMDPGDTRVLNISLASYVVYTNSTKIHICVKLYVFDDRRNEFVDTGDELSLTAP